MGKKIKPEQSIWVRLTKRGRLNQSGFTGRKPKDPAGWKEYQPAAATSRLRETLEQIHNFTVQRRLHSREMAGIHELCDQALNHEV